MLEGEDENKNIFFLQIFEKQETWQFWRWPTTINQ